MNADTPSPEPQITAADLLPGSLRYEAEQRQKKRESGQVWGAKRYLAEQKQHKTPAKKEDEL